VGILLLQAAEALRASGGRMTAQRRAILETLQDLGGHPTADQVYAAARERDQAIHPTTVYRTLGWLADAGLVNPRHLEARGDRCEHFDPALPAEHHHFVCTHCGRVIEFRSRQIEELKAQFAQQHHVSIERAFLSMHGLCEQCREEQPGNGTRPHADERGKEER
jgi:Fe2+ or Zn2+ uptake regulation protein